jgi:hypothetical protein
VKMWNSTPRGQDGDYQKAGPQYFRILVSALELVALLIASFFLTVSAAEFVNQSRALVLGPTAYKLVATPSGTPRDQQATGCPITTAPNVPPACEPSVTKTVTVYQQTNTLPPPSEPPVCLPAQMNSPQLSIFFDNGSAKLSPCAVAVIEKVRRGAACPQAKVKIVAWVSSAEFRADPNQSKNLELAQRRYSTVHDLLLKTNPNLNIEARTWRSFKELHDNLLYKDVRSAPLIEAPAEALNRRVDLELVQGCGP